MLLSIQIRMVLRTRVLGVVRVCPCSVLGLARSRLPCGPASVLLTQHPLNSCCGSVLSGAPSNLEHHFCWAQRGQHRLCHTDDTLLCAVMVFLPRSSCSRPLKGVTPPRRPCWGPEWPGRGQHPRLGSTPCSLGPWASDTSESESALSAHPCMAVGRFGQARQVPQPNTGRFHQVDVLAQPAPSGASRCLPSRDRLRSSLARGPKSGAVPIHPWPPSFSTPALGHLGGCGMGLRAQLQGLHTPA